MLKHRSSFGQKVKLAALVGTLALLPACATAPAQAPALWMGQVAEGGQTVRASVKSWRDMKFDGLVRQQTDFSCGAATMATIFNQAYGRKTTEQQVLVNMLKIADPDIVRDKGFSLLDMKNYALAIGMKAEGYRVEFDALNQLKVPAIALLNLKGYKHFVVIRKVSDGFVQVGDPALGNRVMSRKAFEEAWNNVLFVVVGDGFDPNSALLNPPPPLSAKRMFELRSPVVNAELFDFGLGHSINLIM